MKIKRSHSRFFYFFSSLASPPAVSAQNNAKSLAEQIGFPHDAKLLIVHADDVSMTHSVNAATIKALESQRQLRQYYGAVPVVSGDCRITVNSSS